MSTINLMKKRVHFVLKIINTFSDVYMLYNLAPIKKKPFFAIEVKIERGAFCFYTLSAVWSSRGFEID